jgi:predicted DNA-binding protein
MPNIAASNVQTAFVLPRALKAKIDAHTEKTGVPMAFIVRQLLTDYFDGQAKQAEEKKEHTTA